MSGKLPSIPSVHGLDKALQLVIGPIKSILESGIAAGTSKWLTKDDLKGPGGVLDDIITDGGTVERPPLDLDFTTPPTPTGLTTAATFTNILIAWDTPGYRNHAYTEIWRAEVDDLAQAVLIGTQPIGNLYVDTVDDGIDHFYWIRFVSRAGVVGPFNGTAGTQGGTAPDPARILEAMVGDIAESHLVKALQNDLTLLRGEKVFKVDEYGRVAGMGIAIVNGESGPSGRIVMYADQFAIVTPGAHPSATPRVPFIVGTVNDVSTVGINGQLVVNGSIYGYSIAASTITADKIHVIELSAISANMGLVTAGTFRTSEDPAFRVEISSEGAFPIWVGEGEKSADNAALYADINGNLVMRGTVYASGGTFSGTLIAADGIFTGTVYAENIVGDVIDRYWYMEEAVGYQPKFGPYKYAERDCHEYVWDPGTDDNKCVSFTEYPIGKLLHAPSIGTNWIMVETVRIEEASFRRIVALEGTWGWVLTPGDDAQDGWAHTRVRVNGTVRWERTVYFRDGYTRGQYIPDIPLMEVAPDVVTVIVFEVRFWDWPLTSTYTKGLHKIAGMRKIEAFKKASEGITYYG